ncbi:MAG: glycosyltransferase family 2 protein [Thermoplasmata archaeon]
MKEGPMLSIIIPTMNEERSIGRVIERIKKSVDYKFEIIVVDSSRDRTPEIAREMGARVIREERRGYGRAYKTGFKNAMGEIIVTMDGDNTYPPEEINRGVEELLNGYDFISCERITLLPRDVMLEAHRVGNFILNLAVLTLFFIRMKDSQSGMWIFRKDVLKRFQVCSDGMGFSEEIKIRAYNCCRFREIPIVYGIREGERKLQTFKDGIKNLLHLIKIRFSRCNLRINEW